MLVVEKMLLMRNDLASSQQPEANIVFASGIQKLVDRCDKCLNKYGRYVEKTYRFTFKKVCLLNLFIFLVTRNAV